MPDRVKGAFVLSLELSRLCAAIAPSPTLAIDAKAKEMRQSGRDVVSFSVGEPDFVTPWHVRQEGIRSLEDGKTWYSPNRGFSELRNELSAWFHRHYGVEYNPD